jgi:hypothetical protein
MGALKRFLLVFVLLGVAGPASAQSWMTRCTDTFSGDSEYTALESHTITDAGCAGVGHWTQDFIESSPGMRIATGGVTLGGVAAARARIPYNLDQNQATEIALISTMTQGDYFGPCVRMSTIDGTALNKATGYCAIFIDASTVQLRVLDNGSIGTVSCGSATWTSGQLLRIEATGTSPTTVVIKYNGSQVCSKDSTTDMFTNYGGGTGGIIQGHSVDGWGDNFKGEDATSGGATIPCTRMLLGVGKC